MNEILEEIEQLLQDQENLRQKTYMFPFFLRQRTETLWHPDSPGSKVTVTRTWIGRLLKPTKFATLGEV